MFSQDQITKLTLQGVASVSQEKVKQERKCNKIALQDKVKRPIIVTTKIRANFAIVTLMVTELGS